MFEKEALSHFLDDVIHERVPAKILAKRQNRVILRSTFCSNSIIIKFWNLSDISSKMRKVGRWTKCQQEWQALNRLYSYGSFVPKPLGITKFKEATIYHEALVTSDIGEHKILAKSIHCLSKKNDQNFDDFQDQPSSCRASNTLKKIHNSWKIPEICSIKY